MDFYQQIVKPVFNINDKVSFTIFGQSSFSFSQVCLVHDPRVSHPYGRLYTVQYLGNIVGGQKTLYNNQPLRVLKKALYDSIAADEVRQDFFFFDCPHPQIPSLARMVRRGFRETYACEIWHS